MTKKQAAQNCKIKYTDYTNSVPKTLYYVIKSFEQVNKVIKQIT